MFVRMQAEPGSATVVASRGLFPGRLEDAVRQKARWIGGIAFAGWDNLGWRGGLGERWMRMRDRRGPLAALLLLAGYVAAFLWAQVALANALGAPVEVPVSSALALLLQVNAWLLGWRLTMRFAFTTAAYGPMQGLRSIPRTVVANWIAVFAAYRALMLHNRGGAKSWDKTHHIFPTELPPA
jgi:adsorption protein B